MAGPADQAGRPAPAPEPAAADAARPAPAAGPHAVQVLRTYPAKRPPLPFAPLGERSIARAYLKALWRARRLVYLEDQYLWSEDVAQALADALRRSPELRLVAVVPRYPDQDGRLTGPPNRIGQQAALDAVREAGGDRVAVYDLENERGTPIYVHAKVCVIDDVWAAVGSDNLNRRSWTHDCELSAAVLDETRDSRAPTDPAGLGDGARVFARELRLRLWREHLGRGPGEDGDLLDPVEGFEAWRRAAGALTGWHEAGRRGPRPPGQAREHDPGRVKRWAAWWAAPLYKVRCRPRRAPPPPAPGWAVLAGGRSASSRGRLRMSSNTVVPWPSRSSGGVSRRRSRRRACRPPWPPSPRTGCPRPRRSGPARPPCWPPRAGTGRGLACCWRPRSR